MKPPSGESAAFDDLPTDLVDELGVARMAAQRAGAFIADRWLSDVAVHYKGPIDPVSEADLGAEAIITGLIAHRFPSHRIVAEESGSHGLDSADRWWLVDPLDGTTNFSHGLPHFCVSIASCDASGVRVGVIVDPIRQWTFTAARGGGAWRNGRRLSVSRVDRIDRAVLATGFPYDRHTAAENNSDRFTHLLRHAQGLRRAGSAALDLAFVAAGWLDGYWETRLNPWDLSAGALLVTEAGGRISEMSGGPWSPQSTEIVATGGPLHTGLLDLLAADGSRHGAGGR